MVCRVLLLLALALPAGCGPATAPSSNGNFKVPTLPPGRQNEGMAKPEKK